MRITNELLIDRFLRIHQEIMDRIERAAYQVSSGKRLEAPSDDPAGTSQILNLKRSIEEMQRFLKNVDMGNAWLGVTDSTFDKLDRYIERVKELALEGSNDTQDADSRKAIAEELGQIFGELVDIGNTKAMGKYIFGGTRTDKKPFEVRDYNSIKLGKLPNVFAENDRVTISTAPAFSDLYQFGNGNYKLFMKKEGNGVRVWMEDENGDVVQIDSNGSDDSGTSQNIFADEAIFKPSIVTVDGKRYIYGTFDTGRGIKININGLPFSALETVKVVELQYTKGGETSYEGNGEEEQIQVGYHRYIPINVPGEGVFKPSHRILAAQSYVENIVESLPWDRAGIFTGAQYQLSGITHSGKLAGSAYVIAPSPVNFEKLGMSAGTTGTYQKVELNFYINEAASTGDPNAIYSAKITLFLPAHFENIGQLVDTLKAELDANPILRDHVEVESEGDHLVFYTLKPGANYLYVKEKVYDNASNVIEGESLLGFSSGVGSWGMDDIYTVSQRVRGRASTVLSVSTTLQVTTNTGSITVNLPKTNDTPLYTIEKLEPRLFSPISSGTTIVVSANGTVYKWTADENIETLSELAEKWNSSANWTLNGNNVEPPVAIVREDESHYRLLSMLDTSEIRFSSAHTDQSLYKLGISTEPGERVFTLSATDPNTSPYLSSSEFTALRVAYSIEKQTRSIGIEAHTDGKGGIELVNPQKKFSLVFDTNSKAAQLFPTRLDSKTGKLVSESQIDTVRELIKKVEKLFRWHVKGYVKNERIYFKDKMGGESLFQLEIRRLNEKARNILGSFFIAQEGEGVDLFDIIKDLEEAHAENIPRRMIGKPTDWKTVQRGDVIHTTLVALPDGQFKGDYNTTWTVKVSLMKNGVPVEYGYTGVFAKEEAEITSNSLTLSGVGTYTFIDPNGEKKSITISSGGTLPITATTGVTFRLFLENGKMNVDSASGTIDVNGKVTLMVESPEDKWAKLDLPDTDPRVQTLGKDFKIKYITFNGSLKIKVGANQVYKVDENKKHNLLVTVEDSKGRVVKTLVVKDPYQDYYIRDGVYMQFSSGFVKSGDYFQMKVGGGIREKIGALDEAYNQVLRKRTDVGARIESLKMIKNRYQLYIQHDKDAKAPLEDADFTEAITELQKAQTALRATLMASLRLFTPTLLDFMR